MSKKLDITGSNKKILDIIKNTVATYYSIPIKYLNINNRDYCDRHKIINVRQMAIYLSNNLTKIEPTIIANSFGIYDNDIFSAKACIVHISSDFAEYFGHHKNLEFEVKKLKSLCEKKFCEEGIVQDNSSEPVDYDKLEEIFKKYNLLADES